MSPFTSNSVLSSDPEVEQAVVIGDRPKPSLVYVMVTASMHELSIASQSLLKVVDPDPAIIKAAVQLASDRGRCPSDAQAES